MLRTNFEAQISFVFWTNQFYTYVNHTEIYYPLESHLGIRQTERKQKKLLLRGALTFFIIFHL
jgi:hypothetical protein